MQTHLGEQRVVMTLKHVRRGGGKGEQRTRYSSQEDKGTRKKRGRKQNVWITWEELVGKAQPKPKRCWERWRPGPLCCVPWQQVNVAQRNLHIQITTISVTAAEEWMKKMWSVHSGIVCNR